MVGPQFHRIFFSTEHIVRRMGMPMVKGVMVGECLRMSQQKTCLSQGRKKQLGLGNGCQSVHSLMLPSVQSALFASAIYCIFGQLSMSRETALKGLAARVNRHLNNAFT
jgi:hypothetical protein